MVVNEAVANSLAPLLFVACTRQSYAVPGCSPLRAKLLSAPSKAVSHSFKTPPRIDSTDVSLPYVDDFTTVHLTDAEEDVTLCAFTNVGTLGFPSRADSPATATTPRTPNRDATDPHHDMARQTGPFLESPTNARYFLRQNLRTEGSTGNFSTKSLSAKRERERGREQR